MKCMKNIKLRSKILSFIRSKMIENNFLEFQTPILNSFKPRGSERFFSTKQNCKGKFYALPQAPQQFKQMI